MRAFIKVLVLAAMVAFVGQAAFAEEMEGGIPVGDTGADVQLTPIAGAATSISGVQGDRPLLLVVFMTTCPHCQHAVPVLNEVFSKIDPKKASVMAVAIHGKADEVAQFQKQYGTQYPLAADPKGLIGRPYNIQAVPSFFIMDAHRVVKFEGHGATAQEFIDHLNSLAH